MDPQSSVAPRSCILATVFTNIKFGYGKEQSCCHLLAMGLLDVEFASLTALEVIKDGMVFEWI